MTSSREAKQYPQAVPMLFHYSLRFFARFESASRYYILRCEPDLLGDLVVSCQSACNFDHLSALNFDQATVRFSCA
jgi:hypothetical protein